MDSIHDLLSAYDAAEGKLGVAALKELLKELRKSKVCGCHMTLAGPWQLTRNLWYSTAAKARYCI
jgi:hypothetical protein